MTATILIVEDDGRCMDSLREILGDAGYPVSSAENGMRALEVIAALGATPALILLDMAMPVMDGLAFLSQIRNHAQLAGVPVIAMSADAAAKQLCAKSANVREVLSKPIDVSRMIELVRKHIGQPLSPYGQP